MVRRNIYNIIRMDNFFDKEYCLEVWGDWACFTRPEMKVERVSYDIITPSAARAIFEAIFWKPAIKWQITKIEVLNPIKWTSIRRNEVGAVASPKVKEIIIEEDKNRQQKASLLLKDVRYRLHAQLIFIPTRLRKNDKKESYSKDENPGKYQGMFERRAAKGQCYTQPYLGTREFTTSFKLIDEKDINNLQEPIKEDKDFGFMLYDMDFSNKENPQPMFYRPVMKQGVIEVPNEDSEEVIK
jgi:CRISPR-associated protein Cas5d